MEKQNHINKWLVAGIFSTMIGFGGGLFFHSISAGLACGAIVLLLVFLESKI